uniref:Uncharacterized protein n=1 Tax=Tetraselmis sp. GSL018 TaxID=582737 RepID=A0A061S8N2_9CHLO
MVLVYGAAACRSVVLRKNISVKTSCSVLDIQPFSLGRLLKRQENRFYRVTKAAAKESPETPNKDESRVEILEWDIVKYQFAGKEGFGNRLGRVIALKGTTCEVEPLVEQGDKIWILDEEEEEPDTVPTSAILGVLDSEYGQRAVEDRISNPHGEHAEEIWEIFEELDAETYRGHK